MYKRCIGRFNPTNLNQHILSYSLNISGVVLIEHAQPRSAITKSQRLNSTEWVLCMVNLTEQTHRVIPRQCMLPALVLTTRITILPYSSQTSHIKKTWFQTIRKCIYFSYKDQLAIMVMDSIYPILVYVLVENIGDI